MILGLDVSSSVIGITVLDENGVMLLNEAVKLQSEKTIVEKASKFKKYLTTVSAKKFNIKEIYIEESLLAFRPTGSSAHTISLLAKMNGIVTWLCYDLMGIRPIQLSANTARKLCGIKKIKGENTKLIVVKSVLDMEPTFSVSYTKQNNPAVGTFDRADSYVIAKAGYILCTKQKKHQF